MSGRRKDFEETLYQVLTGGEGSTSAGEIKARLDKDSQFRTEFDQTRKTIASLQGLLPKPKKAPFSSRDFQKLSRNILRGYKSKYASLLSELGGTYLSELPKKGLAHHFVNPRFASPQEGEEKLQGVSAACQSIAKSDDPILEEGEQLLQAVDAVRMAFTHPLERVGSYLMTSRRLNPRSSMTWSREASYWMFFKKNYQKAWDAVHTSQDLAQTLKEEYASASYVSGLYLMEGRFAENCRFAREFVAWRPNAWALRYNLASSLENLGESRAAVEEYRKLFASAAVDQEARATVLAFLQSSPDWNELRKSANDYRDFIQSIEVNLGSSVAEQVEAVR